MRNEFCFHMTILNKSGGVIMHCEIIDVNFDEAAKKANEIYKSGVASPETCKVRLDYFTNNFECPKCSPPQSECNFK